MKTCRHCNEVRPLSEFYVTRPGQYSSRCKRCHGVSIHACAQCGATFNGNRRRKLCSDQCRKLWRPRTVLQCRHCGSEFTPDHLSRQYCSVSCANIGKTKPPELRKPKSRCTREAIRAHGLVAYYVKTGKIARPRHCEKCGSECKPEAAHYNYEEPLNVAWLCRSCHAIWDWAEPKRGVRSAVAA